MPRILPMIVTVPAVWLEVDFRSTASAVGHHEVSEASVREFHVAAVVALVLGVVGELQKRAVLHLVVADVCLMVVGRSFVATRRVAFLLLLLLLGVLWRRRRGNVTVGVDRAALVSYHNCCVLLWCVLRGVVVVLDDLGCFRRDILGWRGWIDGGIALKDSLGGSLC